MRNSEKRELSMFFFRTVTYFALFLLVSGCGNGNQPLVEQRLSVPVESSVGSTQNSDAEIGELAGGILGLGISGHNWQLNSAIIGAGVGALAGQAKDAQAVSSTRGQEEVVNADEPVSSSGSNPGTTSDEPNPPGFEPWPPPRPTASRDLNDLFSDNNKYRTLGDIQAFFETALESSGVYEFSYFNAPGGFALVTPIEQLSSTGTLQANTEMPAINRDNDWFQDWINLLFVCPKGYYGAVVFFVTTDPQGPNMNLTVTTTELKNWSIGGLRGLPDAIRNEPAKNHYIYADVYNFEQSDHQQLVLLESNVFNTGAQLASLGIISKRSFNQ